MPPSLHSAYLPVAPWAATLIGSGDRATAMGWCWLGPGISVAGGGRLCRFAQRVGQPPQEVGDGCEQQADLCGTGRRRCVQVELNFKVSGPRRAARLPRLGLPIDGSVSLFHPPHSSRTKTKSAGAAERTSPMMRLGWPTRGSQQSSSLLGWLCLKRWACGGPCRKAERRLGGASAAAGVRRRSLCRLVAPCPSHPCLSASVL